MRLFSADIANAQQEFCDAWGSKGFDIRISADFCLAGVWFAGDFIIFANNKGETIEMALDAAAKYRANNHLELHAGKHGFMTNVEAWAKDSMSFQSEEEGLVIGL